MPDMDPLEMEQLHPRPASASSSSSAAANGGGVGRSSSGSSSHHTRPRGMISRRSDDRVVDQLWQIVRLYMEIHPVLASVVVFGMLTALACLLVAVVFPHHGPRGRHQLNHDYSKIEYNYNFRASQMENWCLFGEDSDCTCEDFTDPVPRLEVHGWVEAWERNQRSALARGKKVDPLDVVFLGDDLVEMWAGLGLNVPLAIPNGQEIQKIFNRTFTKAGGGALDGMAMGIRGDSSTNLLWRLQHGEMQPKLKSKVWWISVGGEDLARGGCSEEATELGILRVAEEVQWHRPNDVVVIQGMLPRSSYPDGRLFDTAARTSSVLPSFLRRNSKGGDASDDRASLWPSMVRINDQLAKFCEGHPRMVYFDATNLFLGTVGNEYYKSQRQEIVKELMPDHVHPSVQGMQVLAQRVEKELMRIIYQEDEANDIEQKEEDERTTP